MGSECLDVDFVGIEFSCIVYVVIDQDVGLVIVLCQLCQVVVDQGVMQVVVVVDYQYVVIVWGFQGFVYQYVVFEDFECMCWIGEDLFVVKRGEDGWQYVQCVGVQFVFVGVVQVIGGKVGKGYGGFLGV